MTDFSTMRTICFTGPRPNKLYGYKNKEKYQKLVDCIHDFLRGFCRIESDEILTVITGGAQGIDQLYTVLYLSVRHLKLISFLSSCNDHQ